MKTVLCIFSDVDALQNWVTEFVMMAPSVKWKAKGKRLTELHTGYEIYHLKLATDEVSPAGYSRVMDYTCQKEPERKSSTNCSRLTLVSGGKSDNCESN